jgi:BMFP domain-containing protein YqiC
MTTPPPFGPNNRLFDDMAKVASGAMGAFAGVRQEMEVLFRQQVERLVASMDLVPREEFDAMADLARSAAAEVEILAARVAALEASLAPKETPAEPRVQDNTESPV